MKILIVSVLASFFFCEASNSFNRVIELTDRFLEVKGDSQWLVMFYAPWCGHCRKMEPVFMQTAQSLANTPVRVGKLDCTRFTSVASELGIKGFPTVLFLKGDEVFTFSRDRTREELVDFARRLSGPPVKFIDSCTDMQVALQDEKLFFVYVGERKGDLWLAFETSAKHLQDHLMFFAIEMDCLKWHLKEAKSPAVAVFKEGGNIVMPPIGLDGGVNETVQQWILAEQFEDFVRITYGNLPLLLKTGKILVLVVVDEDKVGTLTHEMDTFKRDLEAVMRKNQEEFREKVQFGWLASPEIGNSIAITTLPLPCILAVNSSSYQYFLPEKESSILDQEEIVEFVRAILDFSLVPQGGRSYSTHFQRTVFEASVSLGQMWRGNPVLTSVLFGLPLGFLSLICYSIFCGDIMEARDDDEDQLIDDEFHEKKE
ncbi:unnamed protein product [Notodromas monacha]|uniref:Thioredoxin domain-containing protein n=1 Tax=Notodromas monacha TaxID=399045 RepID=A0A7R9BT28_9CRUS|nr:unnamed protein product [Notodromas monacha]CAG0919604.1 unnamed protein product [Notodromas monacha]